MSSKEEKLKKVFDENYHALVYFGYKILDSKSDAEDIVQDAFVKYWNQSDAISEDIPAIKSYLYTSVRNACLNQLRHKSVSDRYVIQESGKILSEKDALEMMLEAETVALLFKAIESLPPVCQKITKLSYLQGKSNEEIAAELNISVNSVKTHKQRGAHLLRKKLSPAVIGILMLFS